MSMTRSRYTKIVLLYKEAGSFIRLPKENPRKTREARTVSPGQPFEWTRLRSPPLTQSTGWLRLHPKNGLCAQRVVFLTCGLMVVSLQTPVSCFKFHLWPAPGAMGMHLWQGIWRLSTTLPVSCAFWKTYIWRYTWYTINWTDLKCTLW